MIDVDKLVNYLQKARKAYYENDSPLMSDEEFDALEDTLRNHAPYHDYFTLVGFNDSARSRNQKINHHLPMLSLAKAKDLMGVGKWIERLSPESSWKLVVQPKIDGLSATLAYTQGQLNYVATRGDGKVGQNISHVAAYIDDIPDSIDFTMDTIEIRGELHLPKDTSYNHKDRPLRNTCAGLINRKEHQDDLRYVRFLAYQILWHPEDKPTGNAHRPNSETRKIDMLAQANFYTFDTWLLASRHSIGELFLDKTDTEKIVDDYIEQLNRIYRDYIAELRDAWNYETDGLVITVDDTRLHSSIDERWVVNHHHHYALAFKPPSQAGRTSLLSVIWQVSRHGSLTPVAKFAPLRLGGAIIERASLHNAENVRKLRLSVGDSIHVERANDVIPYICDNPDGADRPVGYTDPEIWPKCCPSCGASLKFSGVSIMCPDKNCRERVVQSILYWVQQSGMKHIARRTIEALFNKGKIQSASDLYRLRAEDFDAIEGFGERKTANFLAQVAQSRTMSTKAFISHLGIPMVQEKSLNKLEITSIEDFMKFDDDRYAIGRNIVQWKQSHDNLKFMNELRKLVVLNNTSEDWTSQRRICLTGKAPVPRRTLISILEKDGWMVTEAVTRDTMKVICDNPDGNSNKLKKSRKLGIEVLTYAEFMAREQLDVEVGKDARKHSR